MTLTPTQFAARKFNAADTAWHDALEREFGKTALGARCTFGGRGETGTALRAAWDAREAARQVWMDAGVSV